MSQSNKYAERRLREDFQPVDFVTSKQRYFLIITNYTYQFPFDLNLFLFLLRGNSLNLMYFCIVFYTNFDLTIAKVYNRTFDYYQSKNRNRLTHNIYYQKPERSTHTSFLTSFSGFHLSKLLFNFSDNLSSYMEDHSPFIKVFK